MFDSVLNLPNEARMLDVVRSKMATADEVCIAVSFALCSGLGLLIDPLKELTERGGKVKVLTSTYLAVTQPAALEILLGLSGVSTRVQTGAMGFHSKFWWFSGAHSAECWAGSSNLSKGGLTSNLEWNIRGIDGDLVSRTRGQFEQLWSRPDVYELTPQFIERYDEVFQRARAVVSLPVGFVADASTEPLMPNEAQREALVQLTRLRERGERRAAIVAAPGVGKTILSALDVQQSGAKTLLYVSHRLEHLTQARRAFSRVFGLTRSLGLVGGGREEGERDFVFATVASLRSRPELTHRSFDYLVIDEFHHVVSPSYEVLRAIVERAFLLGLTATPDRQDGHDVLKWCDYNVAFEVRIPQAIDRGWLLPFHYFGIADETVDFLKIPWRRLDQVEEALSVEKRVEHILYHALQRGFDGRSRAAIGFCVGRKHARYMAEAFCRRGHEAVAVLGDTSVQRREELYERLADPLDPLRWLFVADILNEGVDIPAINQILFLRPTESATLFLQQLGRGLRLCPGTEVLTIVDFVGHHRAAWITLEALNAPKGAGRRTEVVDGFVIKPPKACEVVLQRRTREILAKVKRFTSKKAICKEAYHSVRQGLGQPVLPIDLWKRTDVPDLRTFRAAYKTWLRCQEDNEDAPKWANGLSSDHPVRALLKAAESDWQAPRVWPYALLWGLCANPDNPQRGFEQFFERWPRWACEGGAQNIDKAWKTVHRKLGGALESNRLLPEIVECLGRALLSEVEGRLLYTVASDYEKRHGGVLRTPAELTPFVRYDRPEIVRHFGVNYDPSKHNTGMIWFDEHGVIITKLDTGGAKSSYQYRNQFLANDLFSWTSQNKMAPDNRAGRRLLEHAKEGAALHLFVQPRSHQSACYLGRVSVASVSGGRPMVVSFRLSPPTPSAVLAELGVDSFAVK